MFLKKFMGHLFQVKIFLRHNKWILVRLCTYPIITWSKVPWDRGYWKSLMFPKNAMQSDSENKSVIVEKEALTK